MRKIAAVFIIYCVILNFYTAASAERELDKWKYYKEMDITGVERFKSFYLDEDIYRYTAQKLGDLRIADSREEFIPYYLVNSYSNEKTDTIDYDCRFIKSFKEKDDKDGRYDTFSDFMVVSARENTDTPGNRLIFTIPAGNFYKDIEVSGSYDGNEWHFVNRGSIYRIDNTAKTEIAFKNIERYRYYRIRILKNMENISIEKAGLHYNQTEVRRESFTGKAPINYEITTEGKNSVIKLHNENRLKISKVLLETEGSYNRHFEIYTESGGKQSYYGVSGDIYSLKFKDINVTRTDLDLSGKPASEERLQVKIFNRDDRPVSIKNITVEYYIDKLVFENTGSQPYRLYFGNTGAARPVYDLEKNKVYIERENQDTCILGELVSNGEKSAGKIQDNINWSLIFNILIGIITVGMIILITRKISQRS